MEFTLTEAAIETLAVLAEARMDEDVMSGAEIEAALGDIDSVSIVTDRCIPETLRPVDIAEIIAVAGRAEPDLTRLMRHVLSRELGGASRGAPRPARHAGELRLVEGGLGPRAHDAGLREEHQQALGLEPARNDLPAEDYGFELEWQHVRPVRPALRQRIKK